MDRVPVFRLPLVDDVFEAELRGMAVLFAVEFVPGTVELIHPLRVPITHLRLALRPPMGPNSELRVAIPIGILISRERLPSGLEWPIGNAKSLGGSDVLGGRGQFGRWRICFGRIGRFGGIGCGGASGGVFRFIGKQL